MRVVIGEDEVLLREGLILVLRDAEIDVVGVAGTAPDLVRLARLRAPDLVIADIRMPPGHTDDGLRAALTIRAARPEMAVLIVSHHVNRRYALELLAEHPTGIGYLRKQRISNVEDFCRDVRRVADGGTVLDPEVVSAMLAHARRDDDALEGLTPPERGPRPDRRGPQQRGDRAPPVDHREGRGPAQLAHLRAARARSQRGRPPPRARGRPLPLALSIPRNGDDPAEAGPPLTQDSVGVPT